MVIKPGPGRPGAFSLRGRADVTGLISGVLESTAAGGQAAAVLLTGEEGIGKTAVAKAAANRAVRIGFAVGHGRYDEAADAPPLSALLLALRWGREPLVPAEAFAELAPLYDRPPWLIDRVAGLLDAVAARGPVLLVLEDVQWADELSVPALRMLANRLADRPVVWLMSARDPASGAAVKIVASVTAEVPSTTVALGPLPAAAMIEIARDRLAREPGPRLRELLPGAGGSPLLAVELLADGDLDTEVSDRLVAGVEGRLRTLSEQARRIVTVGSVLGHEFTVDSVAALLGGPAATTVLPWLAEITNAGVVADDGERLSFRNELQRRAIYQTLPPSARTALHRQAASMAGTDPVALAQHLLVGARGGDAVAAGVLARAAEQTISSAPADAARLATKAVGLLDEDDPHWMEIAIRGVGILAAAGEDRVAVALADRVTARDITTEMLTRAEEPLARPLWRLGLLDTMRARAWQVLARPDVSERDRARFIALTVLADSRSGDLETARVAAEKVLADAQRTHDTDGEKLASWALTEIARNEGREYAGLFGEDGDLTAAWASAQDALAAAGDGPLIVRELRVRLSWIAHLRGELRALEDQVRRAEALPLCEDQAWPALLLIMQTLLAIARGDAQALELARRAEAENGSHWLRWAPEWQVLVTRLARDGQAGDLLRSSIAKARTFAERNRDWPAAQAIARQVAALASGRPAELRQAVEMFRPAGQSVLLAAALADYGDAMVAAGERDDGVAALDEAARLFRETGARGELRRIQRSVRTAGIRRRWTSAASRPEDGWEALTDAERRVADLIADGHSNKSAAAALFLSPNTVATHLRAAFGKLGVSSRLQLAKVVTAERSRSHQS